MQERQNLGNIGACPARAKIVGEVLEARERIKVTRLRKKDPSHDKIHKALGEDAFKWPCSQCYIIMHDYDDDTITKRDTFNFGCKTKCWNCSKPNRSR